MRAMVLAAGLGTRLRPITYTMPKPMVPVANRPVMEHILLLLQRHGFTEVVANLHWFPDLIEERFGDGSDLGLALTYSHEEQLLGSGSVTTRPFGVNAYTSTGARSTFSVERNSLGSSSSCDHSMSWRIQAMR